MNKLLSCSTGQSQEDVRARTGKFEVTVYEQATSRQDYLQRIAVGLTQFQTGNGSAGGVASSSGGGAGGGGGGGAMEERTPDWRADVKREDRIKVRMRTRAPSPPCPSPPPPPRLWSNALFSPPGVLFRRARRFAGSS